MHVYGLCASGPRAGINFLSVMAVFLFLFVNISVNIYTILCEYLSEHLYNFFVPVSDGFGGGNLVESNALWNWVRETGVSSAAPPTTRAFLHSSQLQRACACAQDHGPFNRSVLYCCCDVFVTCSLSFERC